MTAETKLDRKVQKNFPATQGAKTSRKTNFLRMHFPETNRGSFCSPDQGGFFGVHWQSGCFFETSMKSPWKVQFLPILHKSLEQPAAFLGPWRRGKTRALRAGRPGSTPQLAFVVFYYYKIIFANLLQLHFSEHTLFYFTITFKKIILKNNIFFVLLIITFKKNIAT